MFVLCGDCAIQAPTPCPCPTPASSRGEPGARLRSGKAAGSVLRAMGLSVQAQNTDRFCAFGHPPPSPLSVSRSAWSVASIAIRAAPAHARAADRRQGSYGTSGPAAAALTRHCAGIRTLGQPPGAGPRGRLGWCKQHAEMGQAGRQGGGGAGWSFSWDPWTRDSSLGMRYHHSLSVRGRVWNVRHAPCGGGQRLIIINITVAVGWGFSG